MLACMEDGPYSLSAVLVHFYKSPAMYAFM